ncbi:MAG: diguanylate cyclase [Aestuariibacter sp.]
MRILVVEDDPVTRLLIVRSLSQWGHETVETETAEDAIKLISENIEQVPNLIITDWSLPGKSGLELCHYLKNNIGDHLFYIIMLSRKAEVEDLVNAMDSGLDDYIVKPFIPEELRVRVRAGVRIIEQAKKLQFLASHDELTQTWNRRMFNKHLEMEWEQSKRDGHPLSVLLMDIDHFKSINDKHGHLIGDMALQHFTRIVKSLLRPYDIFGRYGGEEFVAMLPETDNKTAKLVAERLRETLEQTPLQLNASTDVKFTVSIGVAQTQPYFHDVNCILSAADEAMYKAKRTGRNKVIVGGTL